MTDENETDYEDEFFITDHEMNLINEWAHKAQKDAPPYVAPPAPARMRPEDLPPEQLIEILRNAGDGADYDAAFFQQVGNLYIKNKAEAILDEYLYGSETIELVSDEEIAKRPDPEWWVEGLIQKGTICVLAGSGGIGKTFLMLHIARCIAIGMDAFTHYTRKGKVLYVAAEGASAFGQRTRAWNDYYRETVPAGQIAFVEKGVNLSSPTSVAKLAEVIKAGEFDLIVLDTWSQLSYVDDENSNSKNAAAMRNVKLLRDAREDSTVVIVHHTDAKATKARGATAIRDNADTVIMAKESGGGFMLSTKSEHGGKQKDAEGFKLEGFKLEHHLTSSVVTYTGKQIESKYWEPIKEVLADGAPHPSTELRTACGIAEAKGNEYLAFSAFIRKLAADGILIKSGKTNAPTYQMPTVATK